MGECNTILSAYTLYRHLGQYCTQPSNYADFDLNLTHLIKFFFNLVESIVGKGENASYHDVFRKILAKSCKTNGLYSKG